MAQEFQLEGESPEQVPWPDLPSLALETIYTYLSRTDQTNMSLVCRKWSKGFESPAVWRSFRFELTENMLSEGDFTLIKFAKKYNYLFRHVHIEYGLIPTQFESWVVHFGTFLEMLTENSELASVSFRYLKYLFNRVDRHTSKNVCIQIGNFLRSQRRLKKLEFYKCSFLFEDSVQLLKASIDLGYLSDLKLHRFVREMDDSVLFPTPGHQNNQEFEQFLQNLACFPNLKTVEIDYSMILGENANSRNIIEMLKKWKKRINLKLQLFLNRSMDNYEVLAERDWIILKQANPYLQVEIALFTSPECQQKTELFVVPNMPLTHITYEFRDSISRAEVAGFLHHLRSCNINENLVHFFLSVGPTIPSLMFNFIPFLNACKNLKALYLETVYPINSYKLDNFLNSLLENQSKTFQQFHVDIFKMEDANETVKKDLLDKSIALLESLNLGMDFRFPDIA